MLDFIVRSVCKLTDRIEEIINDYSDEKIRQKRQQWLIEDNLKVNELKSMLDRANISYQYKKYKDGNGYYLYQKDEKGNLKTFYDGHGAPSKAFVEFVREVNPLAAWLSGV